MLWFIDSSFEELLLSYCKSFNIAHIKNLGYKCVWLKQPNNNLYSPKIVAWSYFIWMWLVNLSWQSHLPFSKICFTKGSFLISNFLSEECFKDTIGIMRYRSKTSSLFHWEYIIALSIFHTLITLCSNIYSISSYKHIGNLISWSMCCLSWINCNCHIAFDQLVIGIVSSTHNRKILYCDYQNYLQIALRLLTTHLWLSWLVKLTSFLQYCLSSDLKFCASGKIYIEHYSLGTNLYLLILLLPHCPKLLHFVKIYFVHLIHTLAN